MGEDEFSDQVRHVTELLDGLLLIVETVSGYRAQLIQGGFSAEASEVMAAQMHGILLSKVMGMT